MTTIWVHCIVMDDANGDMSRAIIRVLGVYDSEEVAVIACKTMWDFIGPLTLNKLVGSNGSEAKSWPGAYYPQKDKTYVN